MPLLGSTVPARIVRVSGTTLYALAAQYLGDWEQWTRIADLNGITDPWINAETAIRIPGQRKARLNASR